MYHESIIIILLSIFLKTTGIKILHGNIQQILENELNVKEKLIMQFKNNVGLMLSNVTKNREMDRQVKENFFTDLQNLNRQLNAIGGNYPVDTYVNNAKII